MTLGAKSRIVSTAGRLEILENGTPCAVQHRAPNSIAVIRERHTVFRWIKTRDERWGPPRWRKLVGVEPTFAAEQQTPDLKSGPSTGQD